ncbi:unnamed protein product, partial [Prorocentrum cordatum]
RGAPASKDSKDQVENEKEEEEEVAEEEERWLHRLCADASRCAGSSRIGAPQFPAPAAVRAAACLRGALRPYSSRRIPKEEEEEEEKEEEEEVPKVECSRKHEKLRLDL